MTADEDGPTLKCVVAWSSARNLCTLIEDMLCARVGPREVLRSNEDTHLIYARETTADVRDWVLPALGEGESVFVAEFERWSGYGAGIDAPWLMRRGH